jgi:hypothetical protein
VSSEELLSTTTHSHDDAGALCAATDPSVVIRRRLRL